MKTAKRNQKYKRADDVREGDIVHFRGMYRRVDEKYVDCKGLGFSSISLGPRVHSRGYRPDEMIRVLM